MAQLLSSMVAKLDGHEHEHLAGRIHRGTTVSELLLQPSGSTSHMLPASSLQGKRFWKITLHGLDIAVMLCYVMA